MERAESSRASADGAGFQAGRASRRPILLVEDDPDILELAREMLEQQGYDVETATNGEEALARLPEIGRPCLILLDLFMPVMDGLSFLRALRADDDHRVAALPVVVVSAAEGAVAEEASAMANGFLRKPVAFDGFLAAVKHYCGPA